MSRDEFETERISLSYDDSGVTKEIHLFAFNGDPNGVIDAPDGSILLRPGGLFHQKIVGVNSWTGGAPGGESGQASITSFLDRDYVRDDQTASNSSKDNWETYLSKSIVFAHDADYKINVSYLWSLKSTGDDIEVQLLFDGQVIYEHTQEPKDKKDQRIASGYSEIMQIAAGNYSVELRFRPSKKNKEAKIYQGTISVERFI